MVCQEPLQSSQGQVLQIGARSQGRGAGWERGVPQTPGACSARLHLSWEGEESALGAGRLPVTQFLSL